jgi:uncharacterized membrane protein
MAALYNEVAGKNRDRLAALSDGVFAFALTVIVLDIRVPEQHGEITTEAGLLTALAALAPQFATYLMSFLTLGIFWVGQQAQLNVFVRSDRDLTWIHLAFLAIVAMLPFSTSLLAHYITFRSALVIYWFNILVLGVMLFWSWQHARRRALVTPDYPQALYGATVRRITIAQALYAFGALLCIINTTVSITFIILVQLNYALAPRVRFLYKI